MLPFDTSCAIRLDLPELNGALANKRLRVGRMGSTDCLAPPKPILDIGDQRRFVQ